MVAPIHLGSRVLADDHPCFVIGEAGVNHNGDLSTALEMVDAAVAAGVDAIKFQLFRVEEQISESAPTADYQAAHTGSSTMTEMAQSYDLPWEAHREIAARCREKHIVYMASCFDTKAVDFYLDIGGEAIKVGSGEITNFPLLRYMSETGKPILLSTGMSTLAEVDEAVCWIRASGQSPVVLFHCVSNYPTAAEHVNLRVLGTFRDAFDVHVGFSDHTEHNAIATAAVALGASMVEKHFTLDRSLPGPDHAMSLEPGELAAYTQGIRQAEAALGSSVKALQPGEAEVQQVARRGLVSARAIKRGEILSENDLCLKRPATGIHPRMMAGVVGRKAQDDIMCDVPLQWEMLE